MAEQFDKMNGLDQVEQLEEQMVREAAHAEETRGEASPASTGGADGARSDDDAPEVPRDIKRTVARLWREAKDQHWRFVLVLISIVLYTAFSVAAPAFSARVIDILWASIQDAFAQGRSFTVGWETGGRAIVVYLAVWTLAAVFYTVQCFVMAGFAERLNLSLRNKLAAKMNRLPLAFFDAHRPGEVVSRATNDLDKMSEVLQTGLLRLLMAIGGVTGAVVMMFVYSPLLACVFLAFSLLSVLVTKLTARRNLELAAERQKWVGHLTGAVEEAYSGRVVIRAFNRERQSSKRSTTWRRSSPIRAAAPTSSPTPRARPFDSSAVCRRWPSRLSAAACLSRDRSPSASSRRSSSTSTRHPSRLRRCP